MNMIKPSWSLIFNLIQLIKTMLFKLHGKICYPAIFFRQMRLVMNLTGLLLMVGCLQVSATGFSQNLTFSVNNVPLEKVFSVIEKQSGYFFFYKTNDLKGARLVSLNVKEATIAQVLNLCFKDQPLSFSIDDAGKMVVIKKASPVKTSIDIQAVHEPPVIRGRVTDDKGAPLQGASVQVKGAKTGTTTNANGEFELKDVETNSTIVISYIGYISYETVVRDEERLTVQLQQSPASINSVVVVGYGSQRRMDVTGAVDQVGKEYFEDRPMSNVTRGLQGVLPNLNIKMTDGKPTRGAAYNIRGATSIGAGSTPNALVLIDGVTGDPENVNPEDIESVTILKDAASAAIYGARAAFGVVLITTKTAAAGKTTVNYSARFINSRRTTTPDLVTDGYTWAKNFDEALYAWMDYGTRPVNIDGKLLFSQAYLDSLKYHSEHPELPNWGLDPSGNYAYYANTDWMKELYKNSNNATEHILSVSSGTDRMKLSFSGRFYSQDGIFRYNPDKFNRYNFRVKGEMKLTDKFSMHANLDLSNNDYRYPLTSQGGVNSIWRLLAASGYPLAPLLNPDGSLTNIASFSIGDLYQNQSFSQLNEMANRNMIGFTALPFKHVTVRGDFTYININSAEERRYFPVSYSVKPGTLLNSGLNYLENYEEKEKSFIANLYTDYTNSFGDHSVKAMIGGNLESYSISTQRVRRDGLIVNNIVDFNLATGTNYVLTGGGNEWATAGLFSRINYSYKNRYLVEFNGRYDGSSRFPTNEAWGFFPSAEAGWIISQEKFLDNAEWLNLLKIRGSYGALGNGNIAPYSFIPAIGVSTSTVLQGGIFPNYIQRPNVYPDNITWERVNMSNLGVDVAFFKNKLAASVDVYERNTIGMITVGPPLPAVFGAAAPNGNNADLKTKGWEISINWHDKINTKKPITYGIRVALADNISKITKFYNPNNLLSTYYEGYRIGDIWGFETLGFFKDAADIAGSPNQRNYFQVSNGNNILPGDLKFADLNKDGFVNNGKNTLQDPGDQKIIGNSSIRLPYSVTTDISWNNISFSAFFQGVGKRDWMPSREAAYFWGQYNRPYSVLPTFNLDRWTEANPDPNAYFPRYRGFVALSGTRELAIPQSRYLQNASYIRLKNISLTYSLPKRITGKIKAQSIRIYVVGENLWTYSPMFKITRNFDPEVIEGSDPEVNAGGGDGFSYPMQKTISVGISIGF
jgi:TonB-linked SusC/RagA family outer membrane protein